MERAALIEALLHSFDADPEPAQQASRQAEAESRIDACDAGELSDDSAEAMFARVVSFPRASIGRLDRPATG